MEYSLNREIMSRKVDGEEVLLDLKSQAYFGLNATGTLIWEAIQAGKGAERIARELSESFEVSPGQARSDVAAFLGELKGLGWLESSEKIG